MQHRCSLTPLSESFRARAFRNPRTHVRGRWPSVAVSFSSLACTALIFFSFSHEPAVPDSSPLSLRKTTARKAIQETLHVVRGLTPPKTGCTRRSCHKKHVHTIALHKHCCFSGGNRNTIPKARRWQTQILYPSGTWRTKTFGAHIQRVSGTSGERERMLTHVRSPSS